MSEKLNLLALVRQHLLSRNEEYQWVTMGPTAEKIGLAYLPIDATGMPCTFMFTELQEPCSLTRIWQKPLRLVMIWGIRPLVTAEKDRWIG